MGKRALEASLVWRSLGRKPQVPFPRHDGVVARIPQQLGQRDDALVQVSLVTGHAALRCGADLGALGSVLPGDVGPFDQVPKTCDVVVCPGHDHGAGGTIAVSPGQEQEGAEMLEKRHLRTSSRSMKVCETYASIESKTIDIWCADFSSEAAYIGEAQVIGDDDEEVGTFIHDRATG